MTVVSTAKHWLAALLLASAVPVVGLAQDAKTPGVPAPAVALADARGRWIPARESRVLPLRRTVALQLNNASLLNALDAIARAAGLTIAYGEDVLRSTVRVTLRADRLPLIDALTTALDGTGLDVLVSIRGDALLVRSALGASSLTPGAIVGSVRDAKTGDKLVRAEVFLDGTHWQAATDSSGRYRLADVDTGSYTLTVRRLGYIKQRRAVTVAEGREDTVNVALEPSPIKLDELVTTATGRQRRLEVPNDITLLNADSLVRTQPVASVTDLLEGRVPGLTVQRTSGAPGDPARLRLRGPGSPLGNNDPVVIVDGIRVYAEQSAARSGNLAARREGGSFATPSPLDYIDPNTIETIEVVKGPSAATLYGQDAANGVIVITTKKGKPGPARWTMSAEHGRTEMIGHYPELLARWGHTVPSFGDHDFVLCPITNRTAVASQFCEADSVGRFQLLNDPALTVLGQGRRTRASLGVSGGTAGLTYNVIGSYEDDLGLPKLPDYEVAHYQEVHGTPPADWMRRPQTLRKWDVTTNITARLGGQAQLSLLTSVSHLKQQRSELEQQLGTLMSTYLDQASGTYYQFAGAPSSGNGYYLTTFDALLLSYYKRVTAAATAFRGAANLDWPVRRWLRVTADAGLDLGQRTDEIYLPRSQTLVDSTGSLGAGHGTSVVSTIGMRANATAPLGLGFQLGVATGLNYTGRSTEDLSNATTNLVAGRIAPGSLVTWVDQTTQNDATFGFYLEPGITHRKIAFTTGLRFDGGKSYGRGVTLPTFPKLGFSYLLSDERFYPLKNLVPTLRLRAAYGRSSRQPGIADRLRLYDSPQQVFVDGQTQEVVGLATLGNTELRPERATEFEGGFDAGMLDDRLTLTVSGYRKTTDDALLNVPVALSVYGTTNIVKNIGTIRNTGLELSLNTQLVRSAPLTWGAGFQLSQNRNVVVKLGPGVLPFYIDGGLTNGSGIRVAPGYPLFGRWAKPVLGYADANGNGVLEPTEVLVGDTAVYVGQTVPNYTATVVTSLSLWGGAVAVTADLRYDNGLSQLNQVGQQLAPFSRGRNDATASLPEQLSVVPVRSPSGFSSDYNWIQTVSTTRLGAVTVTYNAPQTLARRVGAQALSLSLQGDNLGLWTSYRGLDPNVNAVPSGNNVSDAGVLPRPRTWQVRVRATY